MKKLSFLVTMLMLTVAAHAQWRLGVNVGASRNHASIDKQYMTDVQFRDRWGMTFGVMGQYDFTPWLGLRAEVDWMQKNWRQGRDTYSQQNIRYVNNYLQLPVMASFSFGGQRLRGFCNLGVYGGYWLNFHRSGTDYNSFTGKVYSFEEKMSFDDDRDQRWDCGLVGGVGLEYRFAPRWAAQVEARYYYGTASWRKEEPHFKDKRYHYTLGLTAGVFFCF